MGTQNKLDSSICCIMYIIINIVYHSYICHKSVNVNINSLTQLIRFFSKCFDYQVYCLAQIGLANCLLLCLDEERRKK